VPVGPAKFDLNRCNESPLSGKKPDFWPVSKSVNLILAICRFAASCRKSLLSPKVKKIVKIGQHLSKLWAIKYLVVFYETPCIQAVSH